MNISYDSEAEPIKGNNILGINLSEELYQDAAEESMEIEPSIAVNRNNSYIIAD